MVKIVKRSTFYDEGRELYAHVFCRFRGLIKTFYGPQQRVLASFKIVNQINVISQLKVQ